MSHYDESVSTNESFHIDFLEAAPANENPLFYWARKAVANEGVEGTDLSTPLRKFGHQ